MKSKRDKLTHIERELFWHGWQRGGDQSISLNSNSSAVYCERYYTRGSQFLVVHYQRGFEHEATCKIEVL